jgi:hypothetical protein
MNTIPTTARNHICALLPPDARELLARAALEATGMAEALARETHLEEAIARVKTKYPRFFRIEESES